MGGEEVARVVYMVDVEHDEARGDCVGGLAAAVASETAGVRRDDGQLTLETSELVGVVAIEEFDLVADVLNTSIAHGLLDGGPEDRGWGSSGNRGLEAYSGKTHVNKN